MSGVEAVARRSGGGWKVALRLGVSAVFLAMLFTKLPDRDGISIPDDHPLRTALLLGFAVADRVPRHRAVGLALAARAAAVRRRGPARARSPATTSPASS